MTASQPSNDTVQQRDALIETATLILSNHTADEFGMCNGCMDQWSRWMPYPSCTQMRWARQVLETHGVHDAGWLHLSEPDEPQIAPY